MELQINLANAGTVKFGTDTPEGTVRREFPEDLHVLDSMDMISYDQVYDCYFSDRFFDLTPGIPDDGRLEAANMRAITTVPLDNGIRTGIVITLPGRCPPSDMLDLYQAATAAGYEMQPVLVLGRGSCVFSQFTLCRDDIRG